MFRTLTDQGNVGEAVAILHYTRLGYTVCIPTTRNQEYDLVVERDGLLSRVSVKTSRCRTQSGGFAVNLRTLGGNQSFHSIKKFTQEKVDVVFIVTADGCTYEIPSKVIDATSSIVVGAGGKYDMYRETSPNLCYNLV
jgi:Holliday junction resolvase-like predicted endonuclease